MKKNVGAIRESPAVKNRTIRGRAIAAIADQIAVIEASYRSPVDGKIHEKEVRAEIRALRSAVKMLRFPGCDGYPAPGAVQAYNKALARAKK